MLAIETLAVRRDSSSHHYSTFGMGCLQPLIFEIHMYMGFEIDCLHPPLALNHPNHTQPHGSLTKA